MVNGGYPACGCFEQFCCPLQVLTRGGKIGNIARRIDKYWAFFDRPSTAPYTTYLTYVVQFPANLLAWVAEICARSQPIALSTEITSCIIGSFACY